MTAELATNPSFQLNQRMKGKEERKIERRLFVIGKKLKLKFATQRAEKLVRFEEPTYRFPKSLDFSLVASFCVSVAENETFSIMCVRDDES